MLTFATGNNRNSAWLAANAKDDWFLHPGYEEMCPLSTDFGENTSESVKDHSSLSPIHCMNEIRNIFLQHIFNHRIK